MEVFRKENKIKEKYKNKDKIQNSTKMREKRTVPQILNLIYPPKCRDLWKVKPRFFM